MVRCTCLPWTPFRYLAVITVIALGIVSILASSDEPVESEAAAIDLSASGISPNEIALSWTGSAGLPYEVFMNGAFILATETTTLVVSDLTPDTEYCFQIFVDTVIVRPVRHHSNIACATTLPVP